MAAVLGGLGAAVIWSIGTVFSSRAARQIGAMLTLAWVMLVGLFALCLILPFSGSQHLSFTAVGWLAVGGAGNVGGLLLLYRALRIGQMGVVMPIVATEGGIAALISILTGQAVTAPAAGGLAATVLGVVMTAFSRRNPAQALESQPPLAPMGGADWVPAPTGHHDRRAGLWALAGAAVFGLSLYGTGRAGATLPAAWAIMPPRVVGVVVVAIPLALRRQLRCTREALPLVVAAGLCEVAGFFVYALGARHDIAVAAVMATLAGAISVAFGRLMYRERLAVTQLVGVVVVLAGVATLSVVSA